MPSFPFSFPISRLVLAAGLATAVASAHAEYLWLQSANAGAAHAYVGELDAARRLPASSVAAPRAYLADGKDLPLAVEAERFTITGAAGGDLRLLARRVSGDGDGDGVLTLYQAKFGRTETKAVNDLELVPTEPGGNTFKLMWKGGAVAASQVNVQTAEGWRRVLKPAADGTVSLATPFPGLYVLEVTAKVNGSATVDGRKFDDVRHTATLSFEVPR